MKCTGAPLPFGEGGRRALHSILTRSGYKIHMFIARGMKTWRYIRYASGLLALSAVAIGCNRQTGIVTIPIRGEVVYKGQLLATGLVVYLPTGGGAARQASGKIEADGKFVLTTFKAGDGVVPGEYSIVVYPYDSPAGATRTREQMEAAAQSGAEKPKHIIPEKYSDPTASGLTDTVNDEHSGEKRIELTD